MSRLDAEIEILQNDAVADRAAVFAEDPAGYGSNERSNYAGKAYVSPRYVSPAYTNGAYTKGSTSMGIFSRTRDIIAANFNDMLEKAEDPAKMIRLIILEMEETLVEVRTSSARTIADQKEMRRHVGKLDRLQADWGEKAQLALSKDREDLARAALLEKKKAADMGVQLAEEIAILDDALRAYEQDPPVLDRRTPAERREPRETAHAAVQRARRRCDAALRPARTPGRLRRRSRRCA